MGPAHSKPEVQSDADKINHEKQNKNKMKSCLRKTKTMATNGNASLNDREQFAYGVLFGYVSEIEEPDFPLTRKIRLLEAAIEQLSRPR